MDDIYNIKESDKAQTAEKLQKLNDDVSTY